MFSFQFSCWRNCGLFLNETSYQLVIKNIEDVVYLRNSLVAMAA